MKCDSWASLLAHTFARPCLGHEPKARVATIHVKVKIERAQGLKSWLGLGLDVEREDLI
jgi:hypothetical protein